MNIRATVLPQKKTAPKIAPVPFSLTDKNAYENVKILADYLNGVSASGHILYGHQNDLHRKAGVKKGGFSDSDTRDVTEEYAGVTGIDALSLTGTEHGCWDWPQKKRIESAIKLTLRGSKFGAIVSLSAHMPNFELLYQKATGSTPNLEHTDTRPAKLENGDTNYSGYTPNVLVGSVVQDIMPGKKLNALYTGYLDLVCDYLNELNKNSLAAIWRPFHENTGFWFWWGNTSCTPEEFKALWKYTWEYITNTKGIHNIIWAYSPGSEPKSLEEFAERYPGDEYVDMIGFDMYHRYPEQATSFWEEYEAQCALTAQFALAHKKLFAATETGIAHPNDKALLEKGNEEPDWYRKVAEICLKHKACYFLLWANFSRRGAFYTPYVTQKKRHHEKTVELHGHELLDAFVRLYNDERVLFSKQTIYRKV